MSAMYFVMFGYDNCLDVGRDTERDIPCDDCD